MSMRNIDARLDDDGLLRVVIGDGDGAQGRGTALPRGLISGENGRSALAFVHRLDPAQLPVTNPAALRAWVSEQTQHIDWNPAAWTAVELALLDLIAHREQAALETLLDLPGATGSAAPSAAPWQTALIGEGTAQQVEGWLTRHICDGRRDYKVSLSGQAALDRHRVEALEAGGITGERARAAAHHLWFTADQAAAYLAQLDYPWWAIEEPLAPGAIAEMRRLGARLDLRLVLDESLHRADQLAPLRVDPAHWVALVRVGKMGGLLRALEFMRQAGEMGIDLILACDDDEPPEVVRATRCLASAAAGNLLAFEGAWQVEMHPESPVPASPLSSPPLSPSPIPASGPSTSQNPARDNAVDNY